MSVLSLSYWESDIYWRQNNKHFVELAPQNGGKQMIWRNYVTVTLCIAVPTDDILVTADNRRRSNHQYKYRYVSINYRVQELLLPKDNQGMEQLLSGLDWKQFTGRFQKLTCSTQPAPMLIAWICWNTSVWYSFGGWPITKTRQDKTRPSYYQTPVNMYSYRYQASLFTPGPIPFRSESANRTLANSLPGQIAPWPFRSLAVSFHGTFVSWNFRFVALSLRKIKITIYSE